MPIKYVKDAAAVGYGCYVIKCNICHRTPGFGTMYPGDAVGSLKMRGWHIEYESGYPGNADVLCPECNKRINGGDDNGTIT